MSIYSFIERSLRKPTCAMILPVNAKALTLPVKYVQISKLFALFEFVSILLHRDDAIEHYTSLNWTHHIIEIKKNYFHASCFDNGKFNVAHIWQIGHQIESSKMKKWCPFSMKEFNFMMPGFGYIVCLNSLKSKKNNLGKSI